MINELEGENAEEEGDELFVDNVMKAHNEWDLLTPQVKEHMNFGRFVTQRREHYKLRQDRRPRNQNRDLKHATNKITLPTFDGGGKVTA